MSVTRPLDGWDQNAAKLMRRRVLEGSPDRAVSYAPDSRYDAETRATVPGPLTVQIGAILRRHADLWAQLMREAQPGDQVSAMFGRAIWLEQMREADAEIKRLVAGHTLARGAA